VEVEHTREKGAIRHFEGVHGVAIAAWASVNADVSSLGRGEPIEDLVVEVNERLKHLFAGPWITWVILACKTALGEVDGNAFGTCLEAKTNVLLTFIDEIRNELVATVTRNLLVEGIKKIEHTRSDDSLFHGHLGITRTEFEVIRCVGLVLERSLGETGKLTMMTIIEDGEVLAICGKTIGKAGAAEGVCERVGGEGRSTLLAIGDDGVTSSFEILQGVNDGCLLSSMELVFRDFTCVVVRICLLQLGRAGDGTNEFDWDRHGGV
jgi:hypothetical protein